MNTGFPDLRALPACRLLHFMSSCDKCTCLFPAPPEGGAHLTLETDTDDFSISNYVLFGVFFKNVVVVSSKTPFLV